MTEKYMVRQYRPAYFSGFNNNVYKNVPFDKITRLPFCKDFEHSDFEYFKIEHFYNDELIIDAHYKNGEHRVVGFAILESKAEDNWRYANAVKYNA